MALLTKFFAGWVGFELCRSSVSILLCYLFLPHRIWYRRKRLWLVLSRNGFVGDGFVYGDLFPRLAVTCFLFGSSNGDGDWRQFQPRRFQR